MTEVCTMAKARESAASRSDYLDAMSRAATGVNVVTSDGPAGRAGLTVSAMSSVSVDGAAPQLLICINRSSDSSRKVLKNGVFVVNVLRHDQAHVSDVFAGRGGVAGAERFSANRWVTMASGAPRLADPLVAFDCCVQQVQPVASHYVVFGAVIDVFQAAGGAPLIYLDRMYAAPCISMVSSLAASTTLATGESRLTPR